MAPQEACTMPDREMTDSVEMTGTIEEHRRLCEKHRKCEERLADLRGRLLLTDQEKLEEVTLKKNKLHLKDRMESLARAIKGGGPAQTG